jgi:hypothetical protein
VQNPHYLQGLKDNVHRETAFIKGKRTVLSRELFSESARCAEKLVFVPLRLLYNKVSLTDWGGGLLILRFRIPGTRRLHMQ